MFQKIPALNALAPTQTEPPFQIAQALVLLLFAIFAIGATLKFHPNAAPIKARAAGA